MAVQKNQATAFSEGGPFLGLIHKGEVNYDMR